jgi:hypothetical protein
VEGGGDEDEKGEKKPPTCGRRSIDGQANIRKDANPFYPNFQ